MPTALYMYANYYMYMYMLLPNMGKHKQVARMRNAMIKPPMKGRTKHRVGDTGRSYSSGMPSIPSKNWYSVWQLAHSKAPPPPLLYIGCAE